MRLSRRRFLKVLLVATGGAAAVAVGLGVPLRRLYHRLTDPALSGAPAGPLDEHVLQALLATTDAYAGYPVEHGHYAEFFRWHSETLPGYKALYERFAATVNRSARRSLGCDFVQCEHTVRQKILAPAFQIDHLHTRFDRLRFSLLEGEWRLFAFHIVRPIAALFARTDAWRLAGYDAWPGIPQGLDSYVRRPLRGVK